jgi:hypothetical protein
MVRFFGGVLSSLVGCLPLSAMALGFSLLERGRRCEVMDECADLQGIQRAILLTERALGVMTGWRTLLEYQAARFFLPNVKGFH